MIQRLQSVLLFLAGLAFLGTAMFGEVIGAQDEGAGLSLGVLVLNSIVGLGAIACIFFYKDRQKQAKLVSLLQYLAIVAVLATFGVLFLAEVLAEATSNFGVMALIGLPVMGYILIRFAMSRIKKDIALVRSMDRLR